MRHDSVLTPNAVALSALLGALRSGKQADSDGVMVLVSRQACEEAAALLDAVSGLTAQWRALAKGLNKGKQANVADMADDCADDLERVLLTPNAKVNRPTGHGDDDAK